ncbi:MAG: hypothetical protein IPG05_02570 [Gemmatimonadetes bacterium]|nr:hypothetical protein [Gemmatimonadota bacterium]
MRNTTLLVLATLASAPLAAPSLLSAQSTGTPVYAAPYRAFGQNEIGLSLSDPGNGFALEGSYRTAFNRTVDIGFRGGLADGGRGNNSALLLGSDLRARVLDHNQSFPLDGSFTLGVGVASGDGYTVGYLPLGFTMGRRVLIEGSSASLVPYVHPVLMPKFGDGSGTDFSIGFGLDAKLNNRLDVRFSAALGDRDGIAFTVAWVR